VSRDERPERLLDRLLHLHDGASKCRVQESAWEFSDCRWAAVGIGSRMPNSLMFIIAAINGNVTLSVRLSM
jgi:hypothetical protein